MANKFGMPTADETTAMRDAIKTAYSGAKWTKKVNLMPVDQVSAVYSSLKQQNKI